MKTLAFFFALMVPVFGRLGETVPECKARYGEPISVEEAASMLVFKKAGFNICVTFDQGRASYIFISKEKPSSGFSIGDPEISVAERETFRNANTGGSKWILREDFDFVNETHDTEDKKRVVMYDTLKHHLMFFTMDYAKKRAAAKEAEEKKALEGF
jgi:hypothetical protein